jgi:hypothetical protein
MRRRGCGVKGDRCSTNSLPIIVSIRIGDVIRILFVLLRYPIFRSRTDGEA